MLWSRKLDQFFDVVASREAPYSAWLDELEIPTQLATSRRPGALGGAADGGQMRFSGFLAMEKANEGPAQNSAFYKALTGDPETTERSSEFFEDFLSITNPSHRHRRAQRDEHEAHAAGRRRAASTSSATPLKAPAIDASAKKK